MYEQGMVKYNMENTDPTRFCHVISKIIFFYIDIRVLRVADIYRNRTQNFH